MKGLDVRQKIRYVIGYYWLWILGVGVGLFLIIYMIYRAGFTVKDYWFYSMYANTMEDAGNGSQLWKDFVDYAGFDTSKKKVEMNASSYFDPSVPGGTNNSYYQAFVALVESGDLDVVVLGKAGLQAVGSSGRFLDLGSEECSAIREKYSDRLVYCTPYDEEYSEEQVPVGIDLPDSLLISKYHLYPQDCALGIRPYPGRLERAEMFLHFVLQG